MRKQATQHPEVPNALIEALETVLARLWQGEFYDYYSKRRHYAYMLAEAW